VALVLALSMLLALFGVAEDLTLGGIDPGDIDMTDLTLGGADADGGIELELLNEGDDANAPAVINGIELGAEDGLSVDVDGTLDDASLSVDLELSQDDPTLIDGIEGAGTGQGQFGIPGAKADNDALADAYLRSVLPGFGGLRGNFSPEAGRNGLVQKGLTGTVALYDALKPLIVAVAEGKRTSTEFTFDSAALGTENHWWTVEDLDIVSFEDKNFGGALISKEGLEFMPLMVALLEDCPYHLYWFDKTRGWSTSYRYSTQGDKVRLTSMTLSSVTC
jgi:hypothetical protein